MTLFDASFPHTLPTMPPPPLVQTKLLPPACPPLVDRPDVITHLAQALRAPLTTLIAPAGFGKTTLLTAWVLTTSLPTAWLSLDATDTSLLLFWRYMLTALATLVPACTTLCAELAMGCPLIDVLASTINSWINDGGEGVLILDNYHLITNTDTHTSLQWFIEHLPPTLHLVILSRTTLPFPVTRWRMRRRATSILPTALCCTEAEATALLRGHFDLPITDGEGAALHAHTQGWIGGLCLLGLHAQDSADGPALLQEELHTPRLLADVIRADLLPGLADPQTPASLAVWATTTPVILAATAPRITHHVLDVAPDSTPSVTYAPSHMASEDVHNVVVPPASARYADSAHVPRFTATEAMILAAIANRATTMEIADQLHIAACTVAWHLGNIYTKLEVHNRRAAVSQARTLGLLPPATRAVILDTTT